MGAVKGGGIVINVVMDMGLVRVGGDDELVPSLRPPHSQLIADTVGVLRLNLPGEEGLAYLVAQHILICSLLPAGGLINVISCSIVIELDATATVKSIELSDFNISYLHNVFILL